jgi:hypothetical protein
MKRIVNKGRRRLGIPGRPAIILGPNEAAEVEDSAYKALLNNKTVARWFEYGVLVIEKTERPNHDKLVTPRSKRVEPLRTRRTEDKRTEEPVPEGVSETGIVIHHAGGGWYQVYVNGFKVTDRNVRKDEAESIVKDYE